jgi:hypothetical protein
MSGKNRWTAAAALVGLLGLSGLVGSAEAQATASISAIANVTGVAPLNATGFQDLNFGAVTAGTPKSANTGRFSISGQPSTPVTVTFTLPSVLTGTSTPGSIPILFGSTDGMLCSSSSCPSFTTFNPNTAFFPSLDATGSLFIGIGGTVTPVALTATDVYTGTITLTVTY